LAQKELEAEETAPRALLAVAKAGHLAARLRGLLRAFRLAFRCCGGLFATTSTARSKRAHASGANSRPGAALFVGLVLVMAATYEPTEPFFAAIGSAITAWAYLEKALLIVFLSALGTPLKRPAAAAFYAIISFQGKRHLIEAALTIRLTEKRIGPHSSTFAGHPLLEEWERLDDRLRRKSKKRSYIAHYKHIRLASAKDIGPAEDFKNFLSPLVANPLNREAIFSDDALYDIPKIGAIEAEFQEITADVKSFAVRLDEALGQNTVYP
jgi:hypothetical protein